MSAARGGHHSRHALSVKEGVRNRPLCRGFAFLNSRPAAACAHPGSTSSLRCFTITSLLAPGAVSTKCLPSAGFDGVAASSKIPAATTVDDD
jgi:hypothetical protein